MAEFIFREAMEGKREGLSLSKRPLASSFEGLRSWFWKGRKKKEKKKSDSGSREGKREGGKLSRGCVSKKDPPWLLVLFVCLCFLHWWNMGCGNIHHRPRRALFRLLLAETIRTILGNALFRQGMRDAVNTLKRKMQVYLRRSSRCFVLTTKLTFVNGMTSFLELQWLSFDLVYHISWINWIQLINFYWIANSHVTIWSHESVSWPHQGKP